MLSSNVKYLVSGPPLSKEDFDNAKKFEEIQAKLSTEEKNAAFAAAMANTAKGEDQEPSRRIIFSKTGTRWPNGIVPYTIDAAFTPEFRAIIASAIDTLTESTCVRWCLILILILILSFYAFLLIPYSQGSIAGQVFRECLIPSSLHPNVSSVIFLWDLFKKSHLGQNQPYLGHTQLYLGQIQSYLGKIQPY